MLYSIHTHFFHRSTMCSVIFKYPSVEKQAPLTTRSSGAKVCNRAPQCRTVLQNWQDKAESISHRGLSIIKYSPRLPQDTKPLRNCSGNRERGTSRKSSWNQISLNSYDRLLQHSYYSAQLLLIGYLEWFRRS